MYVINVAAYNPYGDTTTGSNIGIIFYTPQLTGIDDKQSTLPKDFKLFQDYPNPFNPTTAFSIQHSADSHVTQKDYDMLGNEVAVLINENKSQG